MITEACLNPGSPKPSDLNNSEIAELSKLITTAQSILHAEVFAVSSMTVSVDGLVEQCNKIAKMYGK